MSIANSNSWIPGPSNGRVPDHIFGEWEESHDSDGVDLCAPPLRSDEAFRGWLFVKAGCSACERVAAKYGSVPATRAPTLEDSSASAHVAAAPPVVSSISIDVSPSFPLQQGNNSSLAPAPKSTSGSPIFSATNSNSSSGSGAARHVAPTTVAAAVAGAGKSSPPQPFSSLPTTVPSPLSSSSSSSSSSPSTSSSSYQQRSSAAVFQCADRLGAVAASNVHVGSLVGTGAHGDVYAAHIDGVEAPVAVKVFRCGSAAESRSIVSRVEADFQTWLAGSEGGGNAAVADCSAGVWAHPHVLSPLAFTTSAPRAGTATASSSQHGCCFVMELANATLLQRLPSLSIAARVTALAQAASGLEAMHARGLVHGLVRASSFFYFDGGGEGREQSVVKVGKGYYTALHRYFGSISQRATSSASAAVLQHHHTAVASASGRDGGGGGGFPFLSQSSSSGGHFWRAPELCGLRKAPRSPESDVYAFGITMWETLSGTMDGAPAQSDAKRLPPSEFLARAMAIGGGEPLRPPREGLPSNIPREVWTLMKSCWAAAPAQRPAMGEVLAALNTAASALSPRGGGVLDAATDLLATTRDLASFSAGLFSSANMGASRETGAGAEFSRSGGSASSPAPFPSSYQQQQQQQQSPSPLSSSKASAAVPSALSAPRAMLTPIYFPDPPVFNIEVERERDVPKSVRDIFAPLPPEDAERVACAVCVPFYSEDGYTLRRSMEGLALQREDLRWYAALANGGSSGSGNSAIDFDDGPELSVLAIADGWKKEDGGASILAPSMLEEIVLMFGPTLDTELLSKYMGDGDGGGGGGEGPLPDAVLIEYVQVPLRPSTTATNSSSKQLAHVMLDCSWVAGMKSRTSFPAGMVSQAVAAAEADAATLGIDDDDNEDGGGGEEGEEGEGGRYRRSGGGVGKSPGSKGGSYNGGASATPRTSEATSLLRGGATSSSSASSSAPPSADEDELFDFGDGANERPLYVSLLIKRKNAKKHHSHRWFFEAFAPLVRARSRGTCEYLFATDCGTLYAPYCMAELILHMEMHPVCAAATAHQRIMDKADQADPASDASEGWVAGVLRDVQGYDFESGLCIFNGMHAAAGFLPVVPGPCGMFRAAAITDDIITRVRDICTSKTETDGLIQANLKIAEDRILSYLLVLVPAVAYAAAAHSSSPSPAGGALNWQTHWVPSSIFYFESESTLKELVLQRRRWLNGTTAGYLWLLRQPELWSGVCSGRGLPLLVLLMSLLQLLVFASVLIMPGILIVTGFIALEGLVYALSISGLAVAPSATLAGVLEYSYITIALGSLAAHMYLARLGSGNFSERVWTFRLWFNVAIMVINAATVTAYLALSFIKTDALIADAGISNFEDLKIAGPLSIFYITTPFFLALLHSRESFATMLRTYPTFYFFLPTILADFFAYSVARYDDISWGTKAVTGTGRGSAPLGTAAEGRLSAALRRRAAAASGGGKQGGGGGSGGGLSRSLASAQLQSVGRVKEATARWTNFLTLLAFFASLSIVIADSQLAGVPHYLLSFGASLACISLGIMAVSFCYFVSRSLACGARAHGKCADRLHGLASFAGWLVIAGALVLMVLLHDHTLPLYVFSEYVFYGTYGILLALAIAITAGRSICNVKPKYY